MNMIRGILRSLAGHGLLSGTSYLAQTHCAICWLSSVSADIYTGSRKPPILG